MSSLLQITLNLSKIDVMSDWKSRNGSLIRQTNHFSTQQSFVMPDKYFHIIFVAELLPNMHDITVNGVQNVWWWNSPTEAQTYFGMSLWSLIIPETQLHTVEQEIFTTGKFCEFAGKCCESVARAGNTIKPVLSVMLPLRCLPRHGILQQWVLYSTLTHHERPSAFDIQE